jgi:hypothetical protein
MKPAGGLCFGIVQVLLGFGACHDNAVDAYSDDSAPANIRASPSMVIAPERRRV